jgi:hypothetical protein
MVDLCELAAGHGGFEVGAREYLVYTGRLSHETFRRRFAMFGAETRRCKHPLGFTRSRLVCRVPVDQEANVLSQTNLGVPPTTTRDGSRRGGRPE